MLYKIIQEVNKGKFVKNNRFNNYGSVATDCLLAQQEEADRSLAQIKLQRNKKIN